MKWLALAGLLCAAALASENPQLQQVKTVYILSMPGGFDQFLANQITKLGLFSVVVDPQRADAVLTDHLGESFQKKLDDLYPPPKVETAKAAKGDKKEDKGENDNSAMLAVPEGPPLGMTSSFGQGKGTLFLVDRKTRSVLWSAYDRPHSTRPDQLEKTADQVARRLKRDLNPKQPAQLPR